MDADLPDEPAASAAPAPAAPALLGGLQTHTHG